MSNNNSNFQLNETAKKLIADAKVLVIGAGSLGCPTLQYLVAMGVGTIGVVDHGFVVNEGLNAKILFSPADKDFKKIMIVTKRLQRQNLDITIVPHDVQITDTNVAELISEYDIIVDCSNDLKTSNTLNSAGIVSNKPIVYASLSGFEGLITVFNVKNADGSVSTNIKDLSTKQIDFANEQEQSNINLLTLAGIIGSIQANEVIKLIINTGELLNGKAFIFNALTLQSRIVDL